MQQDTTTEGGDGRPTSASEEYARVSFTIEVVANLFRPGPPGVGTLINDDTPDLAAARYAHAGMECVRILYGLSAVLFLASRAVESRDLSQTPVNWNVALHSLGTLAEQLSDHAVLCISELFDLYNDKGGER
ncbi:MAG: hypothetical protein ABW250_27730 [Pyrinomonadaceae bacterium]